MLWVAEVISAVLSCVLAPGGHAVVTLLLEVRPVDLHGQVVDPGPGQGSQVTRDNRDNPPGKHIALLLACLIPELKLYQ